MHILYDLGDSRWTQFRKDELVCSDWGSIIGRILVYTDDGHIQSHDSVLNSSTKCFITIRNVLFSEAAMSDKDVG